MTHPRVQRLLAAADGFASTGLDGLAPAERSKRYAFNVICLIGGVSAVAYAAFYFAWDPIGLWPAWAAALTCVACVRLPRLARHGMRTAMTAGLSLIVAIFSFLTWQLGAASGLYLYLLIGGLAIMLATGADDLSYAAGATAAVTAAIIANALLFETPAAGTAADPLLQRIVSLSVLVSLSGMIAIGVLSLAVRARRAEAALEAEHARSEALLANLLPAEIARRLKSAPGEVIADDLPEVTLLFADIADFTPRANSMPPEALVRFLNRIFTEFDRLTDRFGLEKIKTIGDAYMVAAGMPRPRADHAQAVADMALAMLETTARLSAETGQKVEVRIGLHSGAAIAGVIGTQKVFYDVWGDTVNTASRMESHGEVGRIQLTRETRDRLGEAYVFEARGVVDVKGKGPVETFWLLRRAET